jgi:predicted nucleic acid-binding protein
MMLCDAGPLIALIDRRDAAHQRCLACLDRLNLPLIITWPAFTEAAYFLHVSGGWTYQNELWGLADDRALEIHANSPAEQARMRELMKQYQDSPMDLADASLVAAAEKLQIHQMLTLDSHFRAYRTRDGRSFEMLPEQT